MKVNNIEVELANGILRKVEDEFGHSYWHDEHGYCAGVTTILGDTLPTPFGLKEWYQTQDKYTIEKVFKEAQEQGSLTHSIIERLNLAQTVDLTEETLLTKKQVTAYAEWVRLWKPEEMQTEQVIFYKDKDIQFAGTVDIVARIDGVLTLIDIKTSNQVGISAYLQVEAYKQAYKASYNEEIEKTLILQLGTTHKTINERTKIMNRASNGIGWKIHEHNKTWKDFELTYNMWLMLQDYVYPEPPKVIEYPASLKIFDAKQLHPRLQKEAIALEKELKELGVNNE